MPNHDARPAEQVHTMTGRYGIDWTQKVLARTGTPSNRKIAPSPVGDLIECPAWFGTLESETVLDGVPQGDPATGWSRRAAAPRRPQRLHACGGRLGMPTRQDGLVP